MCVCFFFVLLFETCNSQIFLCFIAVRPLHTFRKSEKRLLAVMHFILMLLFARCMCIKCHYLFRCFYWWFCFFLPVWFTFSLVLLFKAQLSLVYTHKKTHEVFLQLFQLKSGSITKHKLQN